MKNGKAAALKNRERQSLSHMGQQIKTKESVDDPRQRCFLPSISCKSDSRASAATMRVDSTVMLSLQSQRIWQCFGSATNLTALIIYSVTFTVARTTSSTTFLNNAGVTLHRIVTSAPNEHIGIAFLTENLCECNKTVADDEMRLYHP